MEIKNSILSEAIFSRAFREFSELEIAPVLARSLKKAHEKFAVEYLSKKHSFIMLLMQQKQH